MVLTRPDARRSRRGEPEPSPVKQAAQALDIAVTHDITDLSDVDADLGVVVAYGRIIPASLLDELPMVNLHFSLLPRWRGAAPVERALLAGDEVTGVCVMDVVDELDAGDVYASQEVPITADATLSSLRDELVQVGTGLLLDGLRNGFGPPEPQVGEVTYAHKITSDDLALDFTRPVDRVLRVVAVGGAWTTFEGRRFKVHRARPAGRERGGAELGTLVVDASNATPLVAVADGWLALEEVQPEGRARLDAPAWARGAHLGPGSRLGT